MIDQVSDEGSLSEPFSTTKDENDDVKRASRVERILTRKVTGLGMEDPVFGTVEYTLEPPSHPSEQNLKSQYAYNRSYQIADQGDDDMKESLTVASDPTADGHSGVDLQAFHRSLGDLDFRVSSYSRNELALLLEEVFSDEKKEEVPDPPKSSSLDEALKGESSARRHFWDDRNPPKIAERKKSADRDLQELKDRAPSLVQRTTSQSDIDEVMGDYDLDNHVKAKDTTPRMANRVSSLHARRTSKDSSVVNDSCHLDENMSKINEAAHSISRLSPHGSPQLNKSPQQAEQKDIDTPLVNHCNNSSNEKFSPLRSIFAPHDFEEEDKEPCRTLTEKLDHLSRNEATDFRSKSYSMRRRVSTMKRQKPRRAVELQNMLVVEHKDNASLQGSSGKDHAGQVRPSNPPHTTSSSEDEILIVPPLGHPYRDIVMKPPSRTASIGREITDEGMRPPVRTSSYDSTSSDSIGTWAKESRAARPLRRGKRPQHQPVRPGRADADAAPMLPPVSCMTEIPMRGTRPELRTVPMHATDRAKLVKHGDSSSKKEDDTKRNNGGDGMQGHTTHTTKTTTSETTIHLPNGMNTTSHSAASFDDSTWLTDGSGHGEHNALFDWGSKTTENVAF